MPNSLRPLIVCDETGRFLFLAYTDKKGYKKSLEHGTLWASHPETDRILPNGGEGVLKLMEDRGSYFYAEVSVTSSLSPSETNSETTQDAEKTFEIDGSLHRLLALIKERKESLPPESYASQLFLAGGPEVRKKLGEKTIELLLSQKREELVNEAADLLFLFLVFLETECVEFSQILDALSSRQ